MYQSLTIDKEILSEITTTFIGSELEEGFLLGCSSQLNRITHAKYLPAINAGLHFYTPNSLRATEFIQRWTAQGICFCGFIHSHVANKQDLSKADIDFAETLIQTYKLPLLWFGLAVVGCSTVTYRFYSITKDGSSVCISSVPFKKTSPG